MSYFSPSGNKLLWERILGTSFGGNEFTGKQIPRTNLLVPSPMELLGTNLLETDEVLLSD